MPSRTARTAWTGSLTEGSGRGRDITAVVCAGLDAGAFAKVAQEAKESCPVSKALTGLEITVDAALET
jgi:organic hydroperoxide reductase OsmC/OhrA